MRYVRLNGDIITSSVAGDAAPNDMTLVPPALDNLSPKRLRYIGGAFVDAATLTTFYIDAAGTPHAVQSDPSWQSLACAWSDDLVKDPITGQWRKTVSADALIAYAEAKQQQIAQGGFTVNANAAGAVLRLAVSTSPAYVGYLSSAVQLAQLMQASAIPTQSINWDQDGGSVSLTPTQVITAGVAVATQVQQSFTVLGQIKAAINFGTITTKDQVDTPPAPIPAWPVNS